MVAKVVASEIVNKVTTEGINESIYKLRRLEGQLNKVKKALNKTAMGFKDQSKYVETSTKKVESVLRKSNDRIKRASSSGDYMDVFSPTMKNKAKRKDYEDFWKDALKTQDKAQKDSLVSQQKAAKKGAMIESARIKQAVGDITRKSGSGRAKDSIFAQMLRDEEKSGRRKGIDKSGIIRDRAAESKRIMGGGKMDPAMVKNYQIQMARLANQFRNTDMTARTYNRQMRQINHELRAASRNTSTLSMKFNKLRTSMVAATAAYSGGAAAGDVLGVGQMFQTSQAAMKSFSNDVGKDFQFVQDEAKRLGLDLQTATDGFTKLGVSAQGQLTADETKALFTGLSEYATAVGVDKFRYEKSITALGQILNKNVLMAEEVKSQIGEQLPGSVQIFAKTLGMTTQEFFKAMEAGNLMAKDVLPKVSSSFSEAARRGGALDEMLKSSRVEQNRLTYEFQQFKNLIFTSGFDKAMSNLFKSLSQLLEVAKPLANVLGTSLKIAVTTLLLPMRLITSLILDLSDLLGFKLDGNIIKVATSWATLAASMWAVWKIGSKMKALGGSLFGKMTPAVKSVKNNPKALLKGGPLTGVATAVGGSFLTSHLNDYFGITDKSMTEGKYANLFTGSQSMKSFTQIGKDAAGIGKWYNDPVFRTGTDEGKVIKVESHIMIDGEPIKSIARKEISNDYNTTMANVIE